MKKDWRGTRTSIYSSLGASNHSLDERALDDYYATDPSALDALFSNESFSKFIWEPACGAGHLSKRMIKDFRKEVYSTDVVNRGFGDDFFDFLTSRKMWVGDIITNPPYAYAKEFVEKAMSLLRPKHKLALFLKLTFLEGMSRYEMFQRYPPKKILVYSARQRVAKNGDPTEFAKASAVCYAWFIWTKGFAGNPEVYWIKPK